MIFYLSNRLESLAIHLKENLFTASTFFSERIVIVPSRAMKEWLSFYLADSLGILSGIRFYYLEEAISHFLGEKQTPFSDISLFLSIVEFLQETPSYERVKTLLFLFKKYQLYGKELLLKWQAEPQNWQEKLAADVFSHTPPLFTKFEKKEIPHSDTSLSFFGFQHLPPLYFSFFEELAKSLPTFFYHLSPCKEFWSDLSSDKEISRLLKKKSENTQAAFETVLEDRHPLLANLGKLERNLALYIENKGFETIEVYEEWQKESALHALQQSILCLEKPMPPKEDHSLQVHISTTRGREVENLYNTLLFLSQEHGFKPKEILVMAPDISLYAPYITANFGEKLPYRIQDLLVEERESEMGGLFQLLELEERRYSVSSLLELFSHPLFRKKLGWDEESLAEIPSLVEKGNIKWGVNLEHVHALLHTKEGFTDDGATWEGGLRRIKQESHPLMSLILRLYVELRPLFDGTTKTFVEWVEFLVKLTETWFSVSDNEVIEKWEVLKEASISEKKHPFSLHFPLFKDLFAKKKSGINEKELQAITFTSFSPYHALPAKIICLIGMEREFPKKEMGCALNLLKGKVPYPSKEDFDRSQFLSALILAKEFFIVSYVKNSEEVPSAIIEEFLSYVSLKNIVIHPDSPFDPLYFQKRHPLLRSASLSDFEACKMLYKPKLRPLAQPFHESSIPEGEHVVDIGKLRRAIRAPISYYLKERWNISFWEEEKKEDEESFFHSYKELGALKKRLINPLSHIKKWEEEGRGPLGEFKKITQFRLEKERGKLPPFHFTSLTLSFGEKELRREENEGWKAPPLSFQFDAKRVIHFVGTLEGVCEAGLFTYDKSQIISAVKHWSDFLVLQLTPKEVGGRDLYFAKDKVCKAPFFSSPDPYLKELLTYFFSCASSPSFLFPECVEAALKKEKDSFEAALEEKKIFDKGGEWLLWQKPLLDETLEKVSAKLFKEMIDAWF